MKYVNMSMAVHFMLPPPHSKHKETAVRIRTQHIDSVGADNVLCELHVNAMTYHDQ
jgi:hypothetical protein